MFSHISTMRSVLLLLIFALPNAWAADAPQPIRSGEDVAISTAEAGKFGGRLSIALRSEPKTFNPVTLVDGSSREITGRMQADLLHINRASQQTEPALAKSWKVSKDGLTYTLALRHGIRFS